MRKSLKSVFFNRKWWELLGVACSAGSVGYGVAKYQENDFCTTLKTGASLNNGYLPCESRTSQPTGSSSIFPTSLFSHVAAATKLQDSLIIRTEDVVPEPSINAPRTSQIMRYGFPSLTNIRSLNDYVLSYDTRTRIPHWVFEHLNSHTVAKNDSVNRDKCDFHEDGSIHEYFRSSNKDYKHSGFDRGHLAAAGNHRLTQEYCQETFLLSNMAPQVGRGFNRDKWNELEQYCRRLARDHRNVYVCSGPLFLPHSEEDGHLYVRYRVLGANHVAVPTHFFKVVVSESESGELQLESFLLPNAVIADNTPLSTFHVPVDVIERASGLLFFDKLNKNKFKNINGKSSGWF